MSITTKTGDAGTTGLMYNRRVSKTHPRVEACGAIDELNSTLGLARATADRDEIRERLAIIQRSLITIMGELATAASDHPRYIKDGFEITTPEIYAPLEDWIKNIEAQNISFKGWATPGETLHAAALDMARSISRRAERRVQALIDAGEIKNQHIAIFLNRLSDCLWLLARQAEYPPR